MTSILDYHEVVLSEPTRHANQYRPGNRCNGACRLHDTGMRNYADGQKSCSYCKIFLFWKGNRCPCCNNVLRWKWEKK